MPAAFLLSLIGCGDGGGDGQKPPPSGPEVCDNGVDDDGDLGADCADADCGCPEICDNVADDNGNGLLDCEDPDCAAACVEDCWSPEDEDQDGLADCDDPDCDGGCAEVCEGGADEDADGLSDCADPDCASTCDLDGDGHADEALGGDDCDDGDPEVNPDADERCNDGVDDDCDGLLDEDDPGVVDAVEGFVDDDGDGWGDLLLVRCDALSSLVAVDGDCDDGDPDVNPDGTEICNGGVDDDCDGLLDDLDPDFDPAAIVDFYRDADLDGVGTPPVIGSGCVPGPGESLTDDDCDDGDSLVFPGALEVCDDGIDADCDGDVDCDDADCAADFACGGTCVDVALAPPVPIASIGSTVGMSDDSTPSCAPSTSPDVTFTWTPPAVGVYTIDTAGSSYDTILYVIDGCGGAELFCNDDDPAIGLQSRIIVTVYAVGAPITFAIDGFNASVGSYVLNIY